MTGPPPPVPRPALSDVSRRRTKKACLACQKKKLKVCLLDIFAPSTEGSGYTPVPSLLALLAFEDAEGWARADKRTV